MESKLTILALDPASVKINTAPDTTSGSAASTERLGYPSTNEKTNHWRKTRMSASDQPIVMLRLEIHHVDKWLYFERPAPILPKCLSWHRGLWFDYGDDEGGPLVVDAVYIKIDGSVLVVFEELYYSDATEQSINDFTEFGWTHVDSPST